MGSPLVPSEEEKAFMEFRRKVRNAEVLSASMERLLLALGFSGKLSLVVEKGRVLKSGYEESYFNQRKNRLLQPRPPESPT